jgi:5-methylcytosine-specific restriction endonuclease McrA
MHPEKVREWNSRYRSAHREKIRQRNSQYWATHPEQRLDRDRRRRVRKSGASIIEKIDAAAIYLRDKGICQICRKKVAHAQASLDHIVPLSPIPGWSMGGNHTMANVQLAHRRCNSRRGAGYLPAQQRLAL